MSSIQFSILRNYSFRTISPAIFVCILLLISSSDVAAQAGCPLEYDEHIFVAEAANNLFGIVVASAGDVNNDGVNDLIVGAPGNNDMGFQAGRAYVFSGLNFDTLYVFSGAAAGDFFGASVASVGDINMDGYSDFIIGALGNDAGALDAGAAYVFSGIDGDTLYVFTGESTNDAFGRTVSSAGDVNNDGYPDLIMGAQNNDNENGLNAGRAYVFSGLNGDTLFVFEGEAVNNQFGFSVATAGDVNNDGYADIIVGALNNDAAGFNAGRVYVYSGINGDLLYQFDGEAAGDNLGFSVASVGDINLDGYDDMIMGGYRNDAVAEDAGRAYVYSGFDGDTLFVFDGHSANDFFGISVASAGDVNNDGYPDMIVGSRRNDLGLLYGGAFVYSGLNGELLQDFTGEESRDNFGFSVASAGDINLDGLSDLIIGAAFNNSEGNIAGRAYVYTSISTDCGDVNGDGLVTQEDLDFLINYYFSFGDAPCGISGDVNEDGSTNLADIMSLSKFLNGIGSAPCNMSEPPPYKDSKKNSESIRAAF